jgi:hypothetical protein
MASQQKRIIDLGCYGNIGLVLKVQSGVSYTSQVAGYACQHPEIEGVFYPLRVEPGKAELFSLTQRFKGQWHHIDEGDADFIDKVLRRNGHATVLVDRTRLEDSYEAWVHVIAKGGLDGLSGFDDCEAILIWPNSD